MAAWNIFENDAFTAVELTQAIEKVPFVPSLLGQLNIFEPEPTALKTVAIEKIGTKLSLIQTSDRGAPLEQASKDKRDIRDFRTVRVAKGDTLNADEIAGVRAFGQLSELQSMQRELARRNVKLMRDMDLTHENMRLGAVLGVLKDADGSVIKNWFTEWGITQAAEINFALGTSTTKVRLKCHDVIRATKKASQGAWIEGQTQVHALAGDSFYDKLITHQSVEQTYLNWQAAADLRQDTAYRAFTFGGITFHNYRGTDDGTTLGITSTEAKFFPVNAPGVFKVAQSPAETFEFVNTPGRSLYNMLVLDRDRQMWAKTELYSYPLHICTRPEMLQRAREA